MNTKDKECKGSLKVSEDVISKIAATAASETEGAFCGEDGLQHISQQCGAGKRVQSRGTG